MYLKSLEIQGFKSFPDKISLTFDKGLTAVVGPNGSGKSNIGDAVRWVLGEQSTKTLRGDKMEDVIFSGTVSRKAMGFASVTLNIDNSDKTLSDYENDVAITRKLYRSGDSEYKINGKNVRLKDINELFMDTGLGRDGYAIIGQGRVSEIVSAKSKERREIFEEAAGISKFRYKKNEAERKLSAAQENILRLTDIISELEGRIEPLKLQSEKAQKFIVLADKRKHLEISVWVNRLESLKSKLDELNNKLLLNQNEYTNLENDINSQENKVQLGYRKMQESTVNSDQIRQKILMEEQVSSQIKSDIAVLENDILHSENTIKSISNQQKGENITRLDLNTEIEDSKEKVSTIQKELETLKKEIASLVELFNNLESEAIESVESFDKIGSEINAYYISQSECKFNIEACEKSCEELELNINNDNLKKIECNKKLEVLKSDNIEIATKIQELSNIINENNNMLIGLDKLFNSRLKGFETAKIDFEEVLFELKGKQQRHKILMDLDNNMEGFTGSVKKVLKAQKQGRLNGVFGSVGQLINVKQKYAIAIETALSAGMQNIIVENEDIAKRCIRFLKEENAGRATFLPITSIKAKALGEFGLEKCEGFVAVASDIVSIDNDKYDNVIKSLLGRTVIAENIDLATIIAKKYSFRFKIVTLDGQVINAGGSFTGGSSQKGGGVFTRKNEIESLKADVNTLETKKIELGEKAEKLRSESERLRLDIEGKREFIRTLDLDKIALESDLDKINNQIIYETQLIKDLENIIVENNSKYTQTKSNLKSFQLSLVEIVEKIKTAESIIAREQGLKNQLQEKRADMSEKLSKLKIREMELSKDLELQKHQSDVLMKTQEDLIKNNQRLSEDIIIQQNIISEKKIEIEHKKVEIENMKSNTEIYLEDIKKWQNNYNEQSRYVKDLQQGIKELNYSKEKLSGEITRLQERQSNTQKDFDHIINQLLEVYELTRSEAIKFADKIDDIATAQNELNNVKNKIRSLGNVNVEAIEEYKEVAERYEFMSNQLNDVLKSKRELEKIISDLTEDMCKIFLESFEIINSNFKEIFVELFGGGSAQLTLLDPENLLESGIEINVAPPGKVIKNLISLSGGEQSFVAIAIYFAILKLRPAPFCILDEIDAALDEGNVARYAQYLKRFIDTTQFVMVTHRRSAMDEANVLYGVTMQEDGISKLLKLDNKDFN